VKKLTLMISQDFVETLVALVVAFIVCLLCFKGLSELAASVGGPLSRSWWECLGYTSVGVFVHLIWDSVKRLRKEGVTW